MGPLDLADIEELKVKQGQRRDKIENAPKDKAIKATDKAHKAGNITDREHIENLKNAPNYMQIIEDTFQTTKEGFKIGADAYTDAAKKGWGFAMDMSESMANDPAAMSEHMVETFADFQAASKGFQAGSKFGPWGAGGGAVGAVVLRRGGKELVDKVFGLLRKSDEYIDAATGMKVDPTDSTYFMSEQTERMGRGYIENKSRIPIKNRLVAGTTKTTEHLVDKDLVSKVAKSINKNVSDEAIDTAFRTQKSEFNSTTKAVGYLNKLAKNLLTEFEGKNLRELKFADVDGVTKIVDAKASGKNVRVYEWAFEKDHIKAKEAFKKEGIGKLENLGADFYENLEVGLTTYNRRKNFAANNPVIPDKLSEFLGRSTSLTMQVRKSIDADFAASMSKIPTRYRQVAQTQILEELVYAQDKLKRGLTKKKFIKLLDKQIAEKAKLFEDVDFINALNIMDEHVTGPASKELLDQSIKNPQIILEEIQKSKSWQLQSKAEKAKDISAVQRWIERNRGYGANEASKRARFYGDRSDG